MSSNEVVTEIDRPAPEHVEAFADIPPAVVSDVTTKGRNVLAHEISHVAGEHELLGTAVTVRAPPGDNLMVHRALKLAEAGDVLVIDAGSHVESGIWGELTSASAQAHGLQGTVIDGAVRDVREIDGLGYPVYARAVSPKGSHKASPGSINVPITCGGVTVTPGDVIVGGAEGVAVVPKGDAAAVAETATERLEDEAEMRERVANGEYVFDLAGLDDRYRDLDIVER